MLRCDPYHVALDDIVHKCRSAIIGTVENDIDRLSESDVLEMSVDMPELPATTQVKTVPVYVQIKPRDLRQGLYCLTKLRVVEVQVSTISFLILLTIFRQVDGVLSAHATFDIVSRIHQGHGQMGSERI